MSHPLNYTQIKVVDILFPATGLIFTITRLLLRVSSRKFWWDDALAFASAIFTASMSISSWIHYMNSGQISRSARIAAYYSVAESFYIALWLARLSILYSILRIIPRSKSKLLLNGASAAFAFICLFLCAQVFWVCERQPNWKDKPQPQCSLGLQVAICQLLTDVASDSLLIVIPARLFIRSSLDRSLKIRLVVIFSAAALTTVVSLVHTAYILEGLGPQAIISGLVEISVSLIVCNFVVVLPALWRLCGGRTQVESNQERTFKLTSVRFNNPQDRTHITVVDVETTFTTFDPGVIEVAGIVHDRESSQKVAPPSEGGKNIQFYHRDENAIDSPMRKDDRNFHGDHEDR